MRRRWRSEAVSALLLAVMWSPVSAAVDGGSALERNLVRAYHDPAYSGTLWVLVQARGEPGFTELAEIARNGQLEARAQALAVFGGMASLTGVEPLVAGLDDAEARVRAAAACGIFAMCQNSWLRQELIGHGVAERMVERCFDVDAGVRAAAVAALSRFDPADTKEALLAALRDADASVRLAAVDSLRRQRVTPPLETCLELLHDSDATLRARACWLMSKDDSEDAIRALVATARDDDATVRRNALAALRGRTQPAVIDALLAGMIDADENVRRTVDSLLRRMALNDDKEPRLATQRAEQRRLYPPPVSEAPIGSPE